MVRMEENNKYVLDLTCIRLYSLLEDEGRRIVSGGDLTESSLHLPYEKVNKWSINVKKKKNPRRSINTLFRKMEVNTRRNH